MSLFRCVCVCVILVMGIDAKQRSPIKPARLLPIGDNQQSYCQLLKDTDVAVLAGLGPAGCGKTVFACHAAVDALHTGTIDKIVITRPIVAVDEELGFLPGTMEQKMDPWIRPIMDVLGEFYTGSEIRRLMEDGVIEVAPLAYMRGRTFRRAFLIADEMQNSSPNQMLMMLTRIGEGSKLVLTGDLLQSDRPGKNGLADLYERWKQHQPSIVEGVRLVQFEINDVQRSPVVTSILRLYDKPLRPTGNDDSALIPTNTKRIELWGL